MGPSSLTIAPNSSNEGCLIVQVVLDGVIEDVEMFIVGMATADGAVLIPEPTRTVVLTDSTSECVLVYDNGSP